MKRIQRKVTKGNMSKILKIKGPFQMTITAAHKPLQYVGNTYLFNK